MKTCYAILTLFIFCVFLGCKEDIAEPKTNYFPPTSGNWERSDPESLNWEIDNIPDLYNFLDDGNTRAFVLLKEGKIVLEHYYGKNLLGGDFGESSNWYWASAAKTLTSTLAGIAYDEELLDLQQSSSNYLGSEWSTLSTEQEEAVKVWNHLTMTSGLDDGVLDNDCTEQNCLEYLADPGSRWAYHNAPYTIIDKIVEGASNESFDDYFNQKLRDPIGMDGFWTYIDYNHIYFSTARSMARFGLMIINRGEWDGDRILSEDYHLQMTTSSQDLNPSYGYLWWLNGQSGFQVPGLQFLFNGDITPSAPSDMYAAMGKNGQLLNIVPSQNLVMVRLGENPDNSLVPVTFQEDLWKKINAITTH